MAKKSNIILNSVSTTGKALQKTITDINPNATSAQIVTLAQGLNSLTKNTYVSSNRVDRSSCDGKTYFPITMDDPPVSEKTMTLSEFKEYFREDVTEFVLAYEGSGKPYAFIKNPADIMQANFGVNYYDYSYPNDGGKMLRFVCENVESITPCDVIVRVDETDTESAAEFVLHIVADPEEP